MNITSNVCVLTYTVKNYWYRGAIFIENSTKAKGNLTNNLKWYYEQFSGSGSMLPIF